MPTINKERVFELWLQGYPYRQIAKAVGISHTWAQNIVNPPPEIRHYVAERAKDHCQGDGCGLYIGSQYGKVHDPKAKGLDLDEFTDINSLQFLCARCHREAHGIGKRKARLRVEA